MNADREVRSPPQLNILSLAWASSGKDNTLDVFLPGSGGIVKVGVEFLNGSYYLIYPDGIKEKVLLRYGGGITPRMMPKN